jgi:hypothetical protein
VPVARDVLAITAVRRPVEAKMEDTTEGANMPNDETNWEPHDHEALVHTHPHFHVTHNYRAMSGSFEHLSSSHEHEHDHAAISHSHHPHEDFDGEHAGEAHIHDHVAPVKEDGQTAAAKPRKAAKKTTKAAAEG